MHSLSTIVESTEAYVLIGKETVEATDPTNYKDDEVEFHGNGEEQALIVPPTHKSYDLGDNHATISNITIFQKLYGFILHCR
jgi:hypothetical protein